MSSDARRDADRWLLWYAGGEQLTEDGRKNAVRTATLVIRALLASEPAKAPFVSRNEEWGLRPDFTTAGVPAPPAGAEVREAAEVLDSLVNRVWSMTPEEAESAGLPTIAKVLRASKRLLSALAAPPSTVTVPDDAAVREAAERLVHKIDEVNASTAYIGIWDFAAQHGIRYDGPRFVGELDALRAALSRPAAKGGDE